MYRSVLSISLQVSEPGKGEETENVQKSQSALNLVDRRRAGMGGGSDGGSLGVGMAGSGTGGVAGLVSAGLVEGGGVASLAGGAWLSGMVTCWVGIGGSVGRLIGSAAIVRLVMGSLSALWFWEPRRGIGLNSGSWQWWRCPPWGDQILPTLR